METNPNLFDLFQWLKDIKIDRYFIILYTISSAADKNARFMLLNKLNLLAPKNLGPHLEEDTK